MKSRQIRPAKVCQTVAAELSSPVVPKYRVEEPPWYKTLNAIPQSEALTRAVPVRHRAPDPKLKWPRNSFRPQQITFPEDSLRRLFYQDHPWELARPRLLVELDGKDARMCDWSKGLRQPGMPLSGERLVGAVNKTSGHLLTDHSVVQRQLWLMEQGGLSRNKAYDQARREFYALRQEEEIERRVAREEARYVGAYFGKPRLDIGMELEDAEYEKWKLWGKQRVERYNMAQKDNEMTFGEEDGEGEADAISAPDTPA